MGLRILALPSGLVPAALQFGLDRILVPGIDGVRDVVDARRGHAFAGVAREQERVAESEIALPAGVLGDLHAEEVHVEIAGLRVVGHLIRDVIDGDRLEAFVLGGSGGRGRRGCQREAAHKLAAAHFAVLEILQ